MTDVDSAVGPLCCPTCGARQQTEAATCRRCHCDLSLVLSVRESATRLHRACLQRLAIGKCNDALELAWRRHNLCPDETSRRLVTVSLLQTGRFEEALRFGAQSDSGGPRDVSDAHSRIAR